jgi:hypothetical protein
LLGFVMAAVSVGARMTGMWRIGELAVGTLLLGAVAAMVLGVLAYTAAIAERGPR